MDIKTRPKLKIDNKPAKLMSLDEIFAKVGRFPFQALCAKYSSRRDYAGRVFTFIKVSIPDSKICCPHCSKSFTDLDRGYYAQEDVCATDPDGTHVLGFKPMVKSWIPLP